jgi:hypothetical protein
MKLIRKNIVILFIISVILNAAGAFFIGRRLYFSSLSKVEEKARENYFNSVTFVSSSVLGEDSIPADKEIKRTSLLNTLIERYGYTSYLEIGQGKAEDNFDLVNCRIRVGVDPDSSCNAPYRMTSDEFFEQNKDSFDLVFIDGLHQSDQVYADIINSLKYLNENGTILVHDCNPTSEEMQTVPLTDQGHWTGDVWKAWVKLRSERADLDMFVLEKGDGCGLIRRGRQEPIKAESNLTYPYLDANRAYLLNLKSNNYFLTYLKRDK